MKTRSHSIWCRALAACLVGPVVWTPVLAYASSDAPEEAPAATPASTEPVQPVDDTQPDDAAASSAGPAIEPANLEQLGEHAPEALPSDDGVEYTAPTPTGAGEKSAVTPQAISLPKAEGSVQGMGESFSPVLSSGTATYSVPIALPPGRAAFAPSLGLSYSSTSGGSDVGLGWSLGVPFIGRQSDRGVARYVDTAAWQAEEDRFFYGGGQELVPVDTAAAMLVDCGGSDCAPIGEDLVGWQQYRARVEGAYQRFFRSPDGLRWVVQSKDGSRYDFGVIPTGAPDEVAGNTDALQSEFASGMGRIYRWMLTRVTDPHGSTAYFLYTEHLGERYLADVYYLSPQDPCGEGGSPLERMECTASLADYGRRVHFVYEDRPDDLTSYLSGWAITTARRLRRIEVSAVTGAPGSRYHVRRYHLQYDPASFHSLLTSIQVEGRLITTDADGVVTGQTDTPEGSLGDTITGATLPPLRFSYTTQPNCGTEITGFGGIDCHVVTSPASPDHSIDEDRADLFDVNSDGLPDLIVTDPARYRTDDDDPGVGVFFNGFEGALAQPADQAGTFSDPVVMAVPSGLSSVLTLSNANIVPMDIDADGRSDLLHMPRVASYGYFTPARDIAPSSVGSVSPIEQGWRWSYVQRAVPPGTTDPRIDLTGDPTHIRTLDVNHDSLIDVVRTTGTSTQTWLNLGLLPDGDGRFGSATYNGSSWTLSTDPVERCLPVAGLPVDFADSEIKLGDMNGDGLQDIVRMHAGSLVYWPGRGDGSWGDGAVDCPAGFAGDREIAVTNPPAELNPELDAVYLTDVNADGMDDIVQVRTTAIDVWFNKAGVAFTNRVISTGTPFAPAFSHRVRIVDIDGSATVDVLYANSGNWRWVDLMAGQRPRLLETVTGSLGGETTLEYASSAEDYLADLRDAADCTTASCERFTWESLPGDCDAKVLQGTGGDDCVFRTGGSPVISTVVRGTTTDSGFGADPPIVDTYAYHDAYYDGAEHEFRGFGAATVEAFGDGNHHTSFARTYFHQGRRDSSIASDLLADNPNEPLKGQPFRTESWDEDGTYLSTSHTAIEVRELHVGLDARIVRDTVPIQADTLLYDVADFTPTPTATLTLPHIVGGSGPAEYALPIRATRYAQTRAEVEDVDNLGRTTLATNIGRVRGEENEDLPDETITTFADYTNVDDSLTGWLWRTAATHIEGHGSATPLGVTTFDYNGSGDTVAGTVDVDQDTTYSFSPTLGSPSPEDLISSQTFDAWGNVTAGCAGGDATTTEDCLRYGTATYDDDYAAFPESQAQAVRHAGGGGFEALTTTATWDRALGAVTSVTDPNEDFSTVTYDGLGRLTSVTPPPVVGCDAGMAATRIRYQVATPGGIPISRVFTDAIMSCDGEDVIQSIAYVDGLGRARIGISTGDGTEGREWIRGGYVAFDARGGAARAYDPEFYSGSTTNLLAATALPSSAATRTLYDAFGRTRLVIERDEAPFTAYVYHALSREIWDATDIEGANTPTTERTDGHGRAIEQVIINKQLGSEDPEYYRLQTTYRADGAVIQVTRAQTTSAAIGASAVDGHEVTRTFDYDTAGRRIATTDPDTDNPGGGSWRYLFNRASDLVAVRDPRGCGQDFYYDHAGRPLAEKYIGCTEAQVKYNPSETVPSGSILWTETEDADDVHVLTVYDDYAACWETNPASLDDYPAGDTAGLLGRVACSADRAQRTLFAYDHRGQTIWSARQVLILSDVGYVASTLSSLPDLPAKSTTTPQDVYLDEVNTWVATRTFDHGSRARQLALPPALGFYTTPRRVGRIDFGSRGLPSASTIDLVSGATGLEVHDGQITWSSATIDTHPVVTELQYDPDGQVTSTTYGDGESHDPTVSTIEYDVRRRPIHAQTIRDPVTPSKVPDPPIERPLWDVMVPFDQTLEWTTANDLLSITDNRDAAEWPAGQRPQNVSLQYDDLHHVVDAAYSYNQDSGPPTDEDDPSDWRTDYDRIRGSDALRGLTAPMAPTLPESRVASLQWAYDWLGNMTFWDDDAHAFYERSIGTITNGADVAKRPSALYLAADLGGEGTDRGGYVELTYGVGGNVATMTVHAQCKNREVEPMELAVTCEDPGGSDLDTRLGELHANCTCLSEQHYQYLWDEVNRLTEARRYDRAGGMGSWALNVVMHMAYDGANQRLVRMTYNPADDPAVKWNVDVYPGDLEVHDTYVAYFSGQLAYWPNEALGTETDHLLVGARIAWTSTSETDDLDDNHRITVPLTDLIGTTAAVMDLRSGQLVETSTSYPNGARETFQSYPFYPDPEEDPLYLVPPERQGFTGKEADEEIGVTYFGERYLISRLGRWLSPDPLAIHVLGGGEVMNAFHYVSASLFQSRDPLGLGRPDDGPGTSCKGEDACRKDSEDVKQFYDKELARIKAKQAAEPTPEERQEQWISEFESKYPNDDSIGYIAGPRDEGVLTEAGVRYPIKAGDFLTPRAVYHSKAAAHAAWTGHVHFAELLEAGHGSAAIHIQDSLGRMPTDAEMDLEAYFGWSRAAHDTREVIEFAVTLDLGASAEAADSVAPGFGSLSRAEEFGLKPYSELRATLKGTGLRAHHLVEKRFAGIMGENVDEMLSVAVTPAEHQAFTNAWRNAIGYGPKGTGAATREQVLQAARAIYSGYPEIMRALGL